MSDRDGRNDRSRHNRHVSDELHPAIYVAIAGLGLWYVLSAWAGFATDDPTAYLLAVVSGLVFIAIAIPCALWLASRAGQGPRAPGSRHGFRDWTAGDFKTSQDQLKASSAA